MKVRASVAWLAWVVTGVYYFYQYALRSAPAVMMPQLSEAFNLSAALVASMVGLFYYGYAALSPVAGLAIDRLGARAVIPGGALMTAIGALLFGTGSIAAAYLGRFLQGAGGIFALVGAVYIVSKEFPASRVATLIGATQMFGMAGGAAGQFLVGPLMTAGVSWNRFWIATGLAGMLIAGALLLLLPKDKKPKTQDAWIKGSIHALGVVVRNRESILCGLIAALLFVPTTIFDMIWGVRFLQEAHGFGYLEAVLRSATVPLGWIIGCPLLGFLSDRIGERKPVIVGGGCLLLLCLLWILYGPVDLFPPYVLGLAAGVGSGAAMLLYTVIKEANPPQYSGTATGVINVLNFGISALLGPVFSWNMQRASRGQPTRLQQYQSTFEPLLFGVALAIMLTFVLKESGPAVRIPMKEVETV